jgi:hypothetical protein
MGVSPTLATEVELLADLVERGPVVVRLEVPGGEHPAAHVVHAELEHAPEGLVALPGLQVEGGALGNEGDLGEVDPREVPDRVAVFHPVEPTQGHPAWIWIQRIELQCPAFDPIDKLRFACALLTECEAIIGTVDPECTSEAESISKLRAQIVDFLAGDAENGEFGLTG